MTHRAVIEVEWEGDRYVGNHLVDLYAEQVMAHLLDHPKIRDPAVSVTLSRDEEATP